MELFVFQETRQHTRMECTGSRAAPLWTSSKMGGSKSAPWRWNASSSPTPTSQVCAVPPAACPEGTGRGDTALGQPCLSRCLELPATRGCLKPTVPALPGPEPSQQRLLSDLGNEAAVKSALPLCMTLCKGSEVVPPAPHHSVHHLPPPRLQMLKPQSFLPLPHEKLCSGASTGLHAVTSRGIFLLSPCSAPLELPAPEGSGCCPCRRGGDRAPGRRVGTAGQRRGAAAPGTDPLRQGPEGLGQVKTPGQGNTEQAQSQPCPQQARVIGSWWCLGGKGS